MGAAAPPVEHFLLAFGGDRSSFLLRRTLEAVSILLSFVQVSTNMVVRLIFWGGPQEVVVTIRVSLASFDHPPKDDLANRGLPCPCLRIPLAKELHSAGSYMHTRWVGSSSLLFPSKQTAPRWLPSVKILF